LQAFPALTNERALGSIKADSKGLWVVQGPCSATTPGVAECTPPPAGSYTPVPLAVRASVASGCTSTNLVTLTGAAAVAPVTSLIPTCTTLKFDVKHVWPQTPAGDPLIENDFSVKESWAVHTDVMSTHGLVIMV
jgi:hypothetical protein